MVFLYAVYLDYLPNLPFLWNDGVFAHVVDSTLICTLVPRYNYDFLILVIKLLICVCFYYP